MGNLCSRQEATSLLAGHPRFLALSGPEHVGKRSFISSLLETSLDEADLLVADIGPDGAREALPFLRTRPSFSPFRAVLVDDMDFLSEPAQDSWLKLCEEPPADSCIVAVVSDVDFLLPALRSRVVHCVRFSYLSDVEMEEFAASTSIGFDPIVSRLCCGRPGLYSVLSPVEYTSLFASVCAAVEDPSFDHPAPICLKDLESGRSPARTAISGVVRQAARRYSADLLRRPIVSSLLRLAANMVRVPFVSAEIHWRNAMTSALKV